MDDELIDLFDFNDDDDEDWECDFCGSWNDLDFCEWCDEEDWEE